MSTATSPSHPAQATQAQIDWTAKRKQILDALEGSTNESPTDIAQRLGVHYTTVYRAKRELERAKQTDTSEISEGEDRQAVWGRLLSKNVPLKLRARVMRDLVKSSNPVAASRALEMVLESDGLRKKTTEPSKATSIVVSSSDDVGME